MRNTDYIEFDQKVDRFLRKEMTQQEQEEFKKFLLENPSLLERAQTIAMTIKAMQSVKSQREDRLLRAIQQMDQKDLRTLAKLPPLPQAPKRSKIARYAAAAAVVGMLCLGGTWYYKYDRTKSLGESQYTAYRQELERDMPLYMKIEYEYSVDKEYEILYCRECDSILRGENYPSEEFINVMRALYPQFIKVREGIQLKQTIENLNEIYHKALDKESPYNNYVDDIAWNLSIAYLKVGDRRKPIDLLKDIVRRNRECHYRRIPATRMIKLISAIK